MKMWHVLSLAAVTVMLAGCMESAPKTAVPPNAPIVTPPVGANTTDPVKPPVVTTAPNVTPIPEVTVTPKDPVKPPAPVEDTAVVTVPEPTAKANPGKLFKFLAKPVTEPVGKSLEKTFDTVSDDLGKKPDEGK